MENTGAEILTAVSSNGNTPKTAYEAFRDIRLAELNAMPPHPKYAPVEGLFIPIGDCVTVKEIPQSEYKTQAGIIIPDTTRLEHCKLGIVMNRGDQCQLPVKEGDVIAFETMVIFGVTHKGQNYLRVNSYQVYFVLPPENYLEPHYADHHEKRREKRIAGTKAVMKHDAEEFEKKVDIHENSGKTQFAVTNSKKK